MINKQIEVGSKVWVVLLYSDEENMIAIPQKPKKGVYLGNNYGGASVFVDNDILHLNFDDIFLFESLAFGRWRDIIDAKIAKLQSLTGD